MIYWAEGHCFHEIWNVKADNSQIDTLIKNGTHKFITLAADTN